MSPKPLMLKDYLELDYSSESIWWAPLQNAGATTVRSLLGTELAGCVDDKTIWRLLRSRSISTFTRISAIFNLLPRSFSKKLRRSFWKNRGYLKAEGKVMVKDNVVLRSIDEEAVERDSLFYLSSIINSCSSLSELLVEGKKSMPICPITEKEAFVAAGEEFRWPSTGSQDQEEICGKANIDCTLEDEKEHLSPVSVMDFPYQDEDEDEAVVVSVKSYQGEDEDEVVVEQPLANSPSFEQSIINIERTKNQLLQKIRRFESLANLNPVDLDHNFACTEAHAETTVHVETDEEEEGYVNEAGRRRRSASALRRRLTDIDSLPTYCDFFCEGLSLAEDFRRGTKSGFAGDEELLKSASVGVADGRIEAEHDGEVAIRGMERCGGGWKRFEVEEEIVAVEMTGGVLTWLMEELVHDLLVSVA